MPLTEAMKKWIKNQTGTVREIQAKYYDAYGITPSTRTIAKYYEPNKISKQTVNKQ